MSCNFPPNLLLELLESPGSRAAIRTPSRKLHCRSYTPKRDLIRGSVRLPRSGRDGKPDFLNTATKSTTNQRLDARMMVEVRKVAQRCLAEHATAS